MAIISLLFIRMKHGTVKYGTYPYKKGSLPLIIPAWEKNLFNVEHFEDESSGILCDLA
jgi:hypothetical protein